jgi:hypothetical protein
MKAIVGQIESQSTIKRNARTAKRPPMRDLPTFVRVFFRAEQIGFELSDGRVILIPLDWSKPLASASSKQRRAFELTELNVFWDEIDEIIGVENLLYGRRLYL